MRPSELHRRHSLAISLTTPASIVTTANASCSLSIEQRNTSTTTALRCVNCSAVTPTHPKPSSPANASPNSLNSKIEVVRQFEITPKAFANFSPGLERSDNPGYGIRVQINPEGVRRKPTLSGLNAFLFLDPGFSLRSNPGLKLANAFGVISN